MTENANEPKGSGILNRAYRYSRALARWIKAGRPVRGENEIKAIFMCLCRKCERFDPDEKRCCECGCSVAEDGSPMMNKIAMQTENCPLGKW